MPPIAKTLKVCNLKTFTPHDQKDDDSRLNWKNLMSKNSRDGLTGRGGYDDFL